LAPAFARRTRIGSGPKLANSGQKTARAFRVPRAATYSAGDAAGEGAYRVPGPDAESRQNVGEAVAQARQIGVGEVAEAVPWRNKPEGDGIAASASDVTVDGFIGDVEAASARQTVQMTSRFPPYIHALLPPSPTG
jgi:hypothetical protein